MITVMYMSADCEWPISSSLEFDLNMELDFTFGRYLSFTLWLSFAGFQWHLVVWLWQRLCRKQLTDSMLSRQKVFMWVFIYVLHAFVNSVAVSWPHSVGSINLSDEPGLWPRAFLGIFSCWFTSHTLQKTDVCKIVGSLSYTEAEGVGFSSWSHTSLLASERTDVL